MTTTTLRATVRRRLNQTDNTNTQFVDAMIDELGNQARRMFAAILPPSILPNLRATSGLSVTSGVATYPSDFLRPLNDTVIDVDSVVATRIPTGESWRLRYLEGNDNTKSANGDKYFYESADSIQVLPTSATTINYKYIRKPDDLDGSANADMPLDVDDMVVDFVFEKLMGTRRGNLDLATYLARSRGFLQNEVLKQRLA